MAKRTSPLGEEGSKKLREAIKECNIKTMDDIHNFVKMLTAEAINKWDYPRFCVKFQQVQNEAFEIWVRCCFQPRAFLIISNH